MDRIALQMRLMKIKEVSFEYDVTPEQFDDFGGDDVQVNISLNIVPDFENDFLELIMGVTYQDYPDKKPHKLLEYRISVLYKIADLERQVTVVDGLVSVKSELLSIMSGVAVGSLRGMLALRSVGTIFENYPLPIINITELIVNLKGDSLKNRMASPLIRFKYE